MKTKRGGGPRCPQCGECRNRVARTWQRPGTVRRERQCRDCGARFRTLETSIVAIAIRPPVASVSPMAQNPFTGDATHVRPDAPDHG